MKLKSGKYKTGCTIFLHRSYATSSHSKIPLLLTEYRPTVEPGATP